MPLDLAALLVEAGALSTEELELALARQRDAGGALDTALLELGLIRERELLQLLSRAAGLPLAPDGTLEPDPRARRIFPVRVAERHLLAPFRLDGRELSLLAAHPVDLPAVDEISFMLSLHLIPHVSTEWRVRELASRLYGLELAPRFAALAQTIQAIQAKERAGPDDPGQAAGEVAKQANGGPPESPPPSRARTSGWELGRADPEEPLAAAVARAVEALDVAPSPSSRDLGEPVPEEPPRWSLGEAFAVLEAARDRDEVVRAFLRYSREFLEIAALFAVTRDGRVKGVEAVGWPEARVRCRAVHVPAESTGVLRAALATRGPYLGPVGQEAGNEQLLASLGRGWPAAALVYPIVLRDRVVCLLYGDNGVVPISGRRIGDLLLFAGGVSSAFERVLRAAKQARGGRSEGGIQRGEWGPRETARPSEAAPAEADPRGPQTASEQPQEGDGGPQRTRDGT